MDLLKAAGNSPRIMLTVDLKPAMGDRFQPTGFANIGAATFNRPDGTRMLLVESSQSIGNHTERTCLDGDGPHIAPELEGIPYVHGTITGDTNTETSSLVEAHRLNSPWLLEDPKFKEAFVKRAEYSKTRPLNLKKSAAAVFHYDPGSLIHGVFFAGIEGGRLKFARLLTGFIEAEDVSEVGYGGVKNSIVDPTGDLMVDGGTEKNIYSNVPYHRTEFVAKRIYANFSLQLAILRSYGLPPDALNLLVALSLYKVRKFLDEGLRLRTNCDLEVCGDVTVQRPEGFALPGTEELLAEVVRRIQACRKIPGLFADPAVTRTAVEAKDSRKAEKAEGARKKGRKAEVDAGEDGDGEESGAAAEA